jgi:hypothetical protein
MILIRSVFHAGFFFLFMLAHTLKKNAVPMKGGSEKGY